MLDRMTPRQFDEWIAFRRIEPDPDERLRVIVTTGFLALCHAWGVDLEPEDFDPALKDQPETSDEMMSPDQAAAAARMAYGF